MTELKSGIINPPNLLFSFNLLAVPVFYNMRQLLNIPIERETSGWHLKAFFSAIVLYGWGQFLFLINEQRNYIFITVSFKADILCPGDSVRQVSFENIDESEVIDHQKANWQNYYHVQTPQSQAVYKHQCSLCFLSLFWPVKGENETYVIRVKTASTLY